MQVAEQITRFSQDSLMPSSCHVLTTSLDFQLNSHMPGGLSRQTTRKNNDWLLEEKITNFRKPRSYVFVTTVNKKLKGLFFLILLLEFMQDTLDREGVDVVVQFVTYCIGQHTPPSNHPTPSGKRNNHANRNTQTHMYKRTIPFFWFYKKSSSLLPPISYLQLFLALIVSFTLPDTRNCFCFPKTKPRSHRNAVRR